jgi:hypothetical protein
MNNAVHLWAIAYSDRERAARARGEVARLACGSGQACRD